jgi:hypothetical protein
VIIKANVTSIIYLKSAVSALGSPSTCDGQRRIDMRAARHSKVVYGFVIISAIAAMMVALPVVFGADDARSQIKAAPGSEVHLSMNNLIQSSSQGKLIPVSRGVWGGQSVSFSVERDSVKIEFDCAEGSIPRQLKADKKGVFRAEGTFTRHSPGPIRKDNQPQPVPALYEGTVKGKIMTLKVTLMKTNESAGEFKVERNKAPVLFRCY